MERRVWLRLIGPSCGGKAGLRDFHTIRRNVGRFARFAGRNSRTFGRQESGREDLNLRPRGPKPRALPS
jgi:hypothetical protein